MFVCLWVSVGGDGWILKGEGGCDVGDGRLWFGWDS